MTNHKTSISSNDLSYYLATKLKNIDFVIEISLQDQNYSPLIQAPPWDPTTLSHGYPALICLFSEMDAQFPEDNWDETTHQIILALTNTISSEGIHNATLFSGLTGICFAIYLASKNGMRYQTLWKKLHSALLDQIEFKYIIPIQERSKKLPFPALLSDTITGITGVLAYLLHIPLYDDRTTTITHLLLNFLVSACLPIYWKNCLIPGWISTPDSLVRAETRQTYPDGCFDTGLAHGIAGPLVVLSKAKKVKINVDGQVEAIYNISKWLLDVRRTIGNIENIWPSRFAFSATTTDHLKTVSSFYRDGWCYGAPGIGIALFAASEALGDHGIATKAISIMESTCDRLQQDLNFRCVSFCHGLAGCLAMMHHMYLKTQNNRFALATMALAESIKLQYVENLPFGFMTEASTLNESEKKLIHNVGLLDGVSGTVLSLLLAETKAPRPWTEIFLI